MNVRSARKPRSRARWVVCIERRYAGNRTDRRVLCVMSRRHAVDGIAGYLEALGKMLFLRIEEQIDATAFNNPHSPFEVTQAGRCDIVYNAHTFLLHAQLSEDVTVELREGVNWLRWRPQRYRTLPKGAYHQPPDGEAEVATVTVGGLMPSQQ